MNRPRGRVDREHTQVKRAVMQGTQHETVSGVIRASMLFRAQMGSIKETYNIETAHDTFGAIALEYLEFETRLSFP